MSITLKGVTILLKASFIMIEMSIMARRKTDKARKQYSIRPDLVKKIQFEAVEIGCFDSAVVEKALDLYFATKAKAQEALEAA